MLVSDQQRGCSQGSSALRTFQRVLGPVVGFNLCQTRPGDISQHGWRNVCLRYPSKGVRCILIDGYRNGCDEDNGESPWSQKPISTGSLSRACEHSVGAAELVAGLHAWSSASGPKGSKLVRSSGRPPDFAILEIRSWQVLDAKSRRRIARSFEYRGRPLTAHLRAIEHAKVSLARP
jgi:hypothetical protein